MGKVTKTLMTFVLVAIVAIFAFADGITPLSAESNATITGDWNFTGSMKSSSKTVVASGDTTAFSLMQSSNVTMYAGTVWTQTYATAFADGCVPVVVGAYTEDPGDVRPLFVLTSVSNQFTLTVTADKNFSWIAVGKKP